MHSTGRTSPLPRCCKWVWRSRRCTSTAFDMLLGFDVVEGQLKSTGGGQPGLEQSELESRWCGVGGGGLQLSFSYGIITVRIMPYTRVSTSGIRRVAQSAVPERHAQRFRELKRD